MGPICDLTAKDTVITFPCLQLLVHSYQELVSELSSEMKFCNPKWSNCFSPKSTKIKHRHLQLESLFWAFLRMMWRILKQILQCVNLKVGQHKLAQTWSILLTSWKGNIVFIDTNDIGIKYPTITTSPKPVTTMHHNAIKCLVQNHLLLQSNHRGLMNISSGLITWLDWSKNSFF